MNVYTVIQAAHFHCHKSFRKKNALVRFCNQSVTAQQPLFIQSVTTTFNSVENVNPMSSQKQGFFFLKKCLLCCLLIGIKITFVGIYFQKWTVHESPKMEGLLQYCQQVTESLVNDET